MLFGVLWSQKANFLDNRANAAISCFMISYDDMFVTANQRPFDFVLRVEHFQKKKKSCVFHSVPVWETEQKKFTKKAADSFRTAFKGNFESSSRKNESLSIFFLFWPIRKWYGCLFPHIPKLPCNWVRYCAIFFFFFFADCVAALIPDKKCMNNPSGKFWYFLRRWCVLQVWGYAKAGAEIPLPE